MKFPVAVLDIEDYLKKLRHLLHGGECTVFIDTNVFALYYSLYPNARTELSGWLKPLAEQGRLKIPVWVLHEYTNRFIRDQTHDYFSPIKRINTLHKEFVEIKAFLRKNTDVSETAFLQDLDLVEEKLKGIYNATKKKNGDHERINEELEDLMKDCVLKSNIDEIIQRAGSCGQGRYQHKMPPGFEDGSKGLNEFGDLIIWYEILDYCRENNLQKVVFLSNDNKKDWVYAPRKIKSDNVKSVPNKELFKIVDPRLVHEFHLATGSEEFYMINFETLTRALINYDSNLYYNLATALQLSVSPTEELAETAIEPESDDSLLSEDVQPDLFNDFDNSETPVELGWFSLDDLTLLPMDDSPLYLTIENLEMFNWYIQNGAIENLMAQDLNSLPKTAGNRSKLFFLGIAIYESACSGSFRSREYIESMPTIFRTLNGFVATHILAGMLYEIYFNSKGEFRQYELKSALALHVLQFQENPQVRYAIEFISDLLKFNHCEDKLLAIPSIHPQKIEVTIYHEGETVDEDVIVDGVAYPQFERITNVIAGTKRLVHENLTDFALVPLSGTSAAIEDRIANFFAVLPTQLQFIYVRKSNRHERQANIFHLSLGLTLGITPKPREAWLNH